MVISDYLTKSWLDVGNKETFNSFSPLNNSVLCNLQSIDFWFSGWTLRSMSVYRFHSCYIIVSFCFGISITQMRLCFAISVCKCQSCIFHFRFSNQKKVLCHHELSLQNLSILPEEEVPMISCPSSSCGRAEAVFFPR